MLQTFDPVGPLLRNLPLEATSLVYIVREPLVLLPAESKMRPTLQPRCGLIPLMRFCRHRALESVPELPHH